jgi:Berberine and berberine like
MPPATASSRANANSAAGRCSARGRLGRPPVGGGPDDRREGLQVNQREKAWTSSGSWPTSGSPRRSPLCPAHRHGRPVVTVVCHAGPPAQGEAALRPLKTLGMPLLDTIAPRPYVAHQRLFDPAFPHGRHYWRSWKLPPLSDRMIAVIVEHAARITSPFSAVPSFTLRYRGPRRRGRDRPPRPDGDRKHRRLVALKGRYDPDNFFRFNHNLPPSGRGDAARSAAHPGRARP